METDEFERDFGHIKFLSKDLNGLEKFADELHGKWGRKNPEYYGRLMLSVANTFRSEPFNDDRQFVLAQEFAELALEKAEKIPIEIVTDLLLHVQDERHSLPGDAWSKDRSQKARLWCRALQRMDGEIDKNWDAKDLPWGNIAPPEATGLPSGVAPEAVKDKKLRAEYEAAIEQNRKKADRYRQQSTLRKLEGWFPQKAEKYLISAYSKPPHNLPELERYLAEYMPNRERSRARMLDAVRKNMAEKAPM